MLSEQLALIDPLEEAIERMSQESAQRLDPPSEVEPQAKDAQEPPMKVPHDLQTQQSLQQHTQPLSWKRAVDLLDTIAGRNVRSAEGILAEIGIEMTRFPTAAHLARLRWPVPREQRKRRQAALRQDEERQPLATQTLRRGSPCCFP